MFTNKYLLFINKDILLFINKYIYCLLERIYFLIIYGIGTVERISHDCNSGASKHHNRSVFEESMKVCTSIVWNLKIIKKNVPQKFATPGGRHIDF